MSKLLYSAVVLDMAAKGDLEDLFRATIPGDFIADHMTIGWKQPVDASVVGDKVTLVATHYGLYEHNVLAVKVEGYKSTNSTPHITVICNKDAGYKPVMSNKIDKWVPFEQDQYLVLNGTVKNIYSLIEE